MRGVITFLAVLFLVGVWYFIGAFVLEPLFAITHTVDLAFMNGATARSTLRDVYFKWAPFVFVASWFGWAVRYYLSPNRFQSEVPPR